MPDSRGHPGCGHFFTNEGRIHTTLEMRHKSPYCLRSSTQKLPKRRSATTVGRYFLRQRSTLTDSHSRRRLRPPRTASSVMDSTGSPFSPLEEFNNAEGNIPTVFETRRQRDRTKATWDFHRTKVLLTITAALIDSGHRRGSCLSPTGYNLLLSEFNRTTSQTLNISQIKSRMVQLGKDWRAWMDLRSPHSRVTGMGWNTETNTWDAPDWWWASTQQSNLHIMKFRYRGLEHADLMEKVFGGSTATGEYHWTPSARTTPPEEGQASESQEQSEFVEFGGPPPLDEPYRHADGRDGSGSGGVRRRRDSQDDSDGSYSGSRRRHSHVARMSQYITDMANVVRSRTNEVRLLWAERPNSMQECVAKLLAMESIDSTSELYLFAIDLFMTEVNREAFMAQPDDAHKLRWLLYQQRKHAPTHRPPSSVPPNPYYPAPGPDDTSRNYFPPNS